MIKPAPGLKVSVVPRIVVGVDGTDRSVDAITLARSLAASTDATTVVACVHPSLSALAGAPKYREYEEAVRAEAQAKLARAVRAGRGVADGRVVAGASTAEGLQRLAETESADLIVVGSTHRGPLDRVLAGSVADRLLQGAPCSVAVAPVGYGRRTGAAFTVIGVGFDGSDEARGALASASGLAVSASATLRVILVSAPATQLSFISEQSGYGDLAQWIEDTERRRLSETLRGLPANLRAEGAFLVADPGEALADESERLDLLVLGSRSYGPVRRVLLGGVSSGLMRRAACPVLVTPRGVERPFGAHDALL